MVNRRKEGFSLEKFAFGMDRQLLGMTANWTIRLTSKHVSPRGEEIRRKLTLRNASKWIATAVAGAMAFSFMAMPVMAHAQTNSKDAKREKNARIGAAALGAAGLYGLSRKQTTLGVAALAGSA